MTPDAGSMHCPACQHHSAYWAECRVTVCPQACVEPAMRGTAGLATPVTKRAPVGATMPSDKLGKIGEGVAWVSVAIVFATALVWFCKWVKHV